MEHALPLISTLALAFALALVFGYIAEKLNVPALLGYICAGIVCSSHTPGPVADMELAGQLSEIGVMLLMFGVGLHFSLADLYKVRGIAVPGAVLQMCVSAATGGIFAHEFLGWSAASSLVFGLSLSCASTVVLLKALEMRQQANTMDGHIAVGWLVVEDIVSVFILVMLPPAALVIAALDGGAGQAGPDYMAIGKTIVFTLLRVVGFVAVMLVAGRRVIPWVLQRVAGTGSRELFTLCILVGAIGIAYGAAVVFNVSFALGAFFAGMVMRESPFAHRAARESLPLQDAFACFFFVGVGMMLDWHVIVESPLTVAMALFIVIFIKSIAAFAVVHLLRYPLHTSLTAAAALSQIGEFSFIIVAQGIALGMVSDTVMSVVVAASILSIAFNPIVFWFAGPARRFMLRHFAWARAAAMVTDAYSALPSETSRALLYGQTIVAGTGTGLSAFVDLLIARGIAVVAVVDDQAQAEEMRAKGVAVIAGDATDPMVLVQAHVISASIVSVLGYSAMKAEKIVTMAKELNPQIDYIIQTQHETEAQTLTEKGMTNVMTREQAVGESMLMRIRECYAKKETTESRHH